MMGLWDDWRLEQMRRIPPAWLDSPNPRWLVISWKAKNVYLYVIFYLVSHVSLQWSPFHMFHFSEVLWSPFTQVLCEPSDRFRCTAFGARRKPLASLVTHCPRVGSALQIVLKGTRDAFKTFMSCQNCTLPAGYQAHQTQKRVVSTCINYKASPNSRFIVGCPHSWTHTHTSSESLSMFADQDLKNFNLLVDSIDDILERADKHLRCCSRKKLCTKRCTKLCTKLPEIPKWSFFFLISIETMIHYPRLGF